MKQFSKRILSFWAALMMVFNIILPSGALAASAINHNEVELKPVTHALTPQEVLGDAFEFGIVANTYYEDSDTETNFAVNKMITRSLVTVNIDGSGENAAPFIINDIDTTNGGVKIANNTNVDVDIYAPSTVAAQIVDDTNKELHLKVQFIDDYDPNDVNTLLGRASARSAWLNPESGQIIVNPNTINNYTIDLTEIGKGLPANSTIYLDCSNISDVISHPGWILKKISDQTDS